MTFPTEQQVEAVARARYERAQCNGEPPWEQLAAQCREDLRDAVRAILRDFLSCLDAVPEWREMERAVERYQCLEIGIQNFLDGKCIADTHRYFTNYMASYRIEYGHDAAREREG